MTTALLCSHEYELCGEICSQDVAVLRLLLAVLHTIFSRVDVNGVPLPCRSEENALEIWKELQKMGHFPQKPILEYLQKWHERFWLFHPERPFAQIAGLDIGTKYSSAKLNGEISESTNKKRLFSPYYGAEKNSLTYAQATRWLLCLNAFDDSSGKPSQRQAGKKISAGIGWLGKIGVICWKGKTLFETLLFNLVLVNRNGMNVKECPSWEKETISMQESEIIPEPDNLSELYTMQSRKILLIRSQEKVTGFISIKGDFFPEIHLKTEPMTAWIPLENAYIPKQHMDKIYLWKDIHFLWFCLLNYTFFNTIFRFHPGLLLLFYYLR